MADAGPARRTGTGRPGDSLPIRPLGVRIGHALGITSTRRAAVLAATVCVLALSVAVPLRNYLSQRAELAAVYDQQHILVEKIAELDRRRGLLADPQHVETQARERLRYVRPGEAPYLVQLPSRGVVTRPDRAPAPTQLWYSRLWKSINDG